MKKCLTLIIILSNLIVNAQKNNLKIDNINLDVRDHVIFIHYDILNSDTSELFNVQLFFTDEAYVKYYFPSKVEGDIGIAVQGGQEKTIIWKVSEEMDEIPEKITPQLRLNDEKINFCDGGPSNAYLSLLVPGLGDYFVADHRNMKFKPYLRTLSSYGLIAMGIIASNYRTPVTKWVPAFWKSTSTGYKYIDGHYEELGDYNYLYFRNDAELFIAAGLSIWAIDILWVAAKGSKNKKYKGHRKILEDIQSTSYLSYYQGGLKINYVICF